MTKSYSLVMVQSFVLSIFTVYIYTFRVPLALRASWDHLESKEKKEDLYEKFQACIFVFMIMYFISREYQFIEFLWLS